MSIKKILIILILGGAVFGGWKYGKPAVQDWMAARETAKLPPPVNLGVTETIAESIAAPAIDGVANRYGEAAVDTVTVPEARNLNVPFTSQAPHANWDLDHNEFCEEAAALMAGRFLTGRDITDKDDAEAGLQELKKWQLDNLGFYYDTTADETAKMIRGMYGLNVEVKTDPSVEDIKRAIANDKVVIVPAAGRELGNPNYTPPGPIYHMLLIRGYTDDGRFITNDAGTRKGEQYTYKQQVVMDAIHDWVPKKPRTEARNGTPTGGKVALFVSQP